jgi:hypothetical protein
MNRNENDVVELAKQTIWEGFRLYAEAPSTSIIENHCLSAVCTGITYEGFNAAISRGPMRPGQVEEVMDLFRGANARMLWHVWPAQQGTEAALRERGLVFYEEEPAMVADLAVETSDPSPIVFREIRSPSQQPRRRRGRAGARTGPPSGCRPRRESLQRGG